MNVFKILIASATLLSTMPALAQTEIAASDVTAIVKAEKTPDLKRNTFELRPVEVLFASVPGVASAGASFETYIGHNWAVNVGGSYADVNLPQKYVATSNDEAGTPLVESGYGFAAGAGVRYYDDPIGDSLYGGGNIDYSEARYDWEFNDESYATEQYTVTPSVTAGYRFVWQNGLMARLGAGVGLPSAQSEKITAETSGPDEEEGLDKVTDILNTKVIAKLDLGLGVMF